MVAATKAKTIKFDVMTADRLRAVLNYNPLTGDFTRLTRAARRTKIGEVAGSVNNEGYRHIAIDGRSYKAHRLAWLYMIGGWPTDMIDHIDADRDNNRFANLREASRSQNLANSKPNRRGKTLPKGIVFDGSRWRARIQRDKKSHFVGSFKTEAAAVAAYAEAARNLFGDFSRS